MKKERKNNYLTDIIARLGSRRRPIISYTVHDLKLSHSKLSHFFPFLFCFIIVQKWHLLGKCSQIVTLFWSFFLKCDNLRSWTVINVFQMRVLKTYLWYNLFTCAVENPVFVAISAASSDESCTEILPPILMHEFLYIIF